MRTHNPENERIKRGYFIYLKEARRMSDPSIDGVAKALNRFSERLLDDVTRPTLGRRKRRVPDTLG